MVRWLAWGAASVPLGRVGSRLLRIEGPLAGCGLASDCCGSLWAGLDVGWLPTGADRSWVDWWPRLRRASVVSDWCGSLWAGLVAGDSCGEAVRLLAALLRCRLPAFRGSLCDGGSTLSSIMPRCTCKRPDRRSSRPAAMSQAASVDADRTPCAAATSLSSS